MRHSRHNYQVHIRKKAIAQRLHSSRREQTSHNTLVQSASIRALQGLCDQCEQLPTEETSLELERFAEHFK